MRRWVARALVALVLLAGCGGDDRPELVVAAASDLRFAFEELGERFEEETGTRVTFTFGSTGQLARQIEQGAPVDLFAAANVAFLEELVDRGRIIPETVALYGRGFLVLWTRDDSLLRLEGFEDLVQPGVRRVSIANPAHAPYGIAAEEALRSAGLLEALRPKLVPGENVNQALQFAQTGNVDVGIIALSLGIVADGGRQVRVPEELHEPIDQALGVVAGSAREAEARAFAAFVNGPVGRPVMERHGFVVPEPGG